MVGSPNQWDCALIADHNRTHPINSSEENSSFYFQSWVSYTVLLVFVSPIQHVHNIPKEFTDSICYMSPYFFNLDLLGLIWMAKTDFCTLIKVVFSLLKKHTHIHTFIHVSKLLAEVTHKSLILDGMSNVSFPTRAVIFYLFCFVFGRIYNFLATLIQYWWLTFAIWNWNKFRH